MLLEEGFESCRCAGCSGENAESLCDRNARKDTKGKGKAIAVGQEQETDLEETSNTATIEVATAAQEPCMTDEAVTDNGEAESQGSAPTVDRRDGGGGP